MRATVDSPARSVMINDYCVLIVCVCAYVHRAIAVEEELKERAEVSLRLNQIKKRGWSLAEHSVVFVSAPLLCFRCVTCSSRPCRTSH